MSPDEVRLPLKKVFKVKFSFVIHSFPWPSVSDQQSLVQVLVLTLWSSALDSSSGVSDQQSFGSSPGLDSCGPAHWSQALLFLISDFCRTGHI